MKERAAELKATKKRGAKADLEPEVLAKIAEIVDITLPREQRPNPYLDRFIQFDHFFARKVMLVKYSCAFVVMPGGFGTLDEAFEIATLMQTRKLERFPLIALGGEFWQKFSEFLRDTLLVEGTISPEDVQFIHRVDTAEDVVRVIREAGLCRRGTDAE